MKIINQKSKMRFLVLLLIICSFTWTINAVGDLSKPSRNFRIGDNYRVWYRYNGNTGYFTCVIEFYRPRDWFMIGWGTSETDIDSWVFQIDGNEVHVSDRYWGRTSLPRTDRSLGGRNDLERLGYLVERDKTTVKIRRRLNTHDRWDKVIRTGERAIYWAFGSDSRLSERNLRRGRVFRRIRAD